MLLFIGWSGETSKKIAESLKRWIENVNPNVVPFVSFEDISLGANWNSALSKALTDANYGVLCVTPDNMKAPWLLYETGLMEAAMRQHNPQGEPYITPLLFGVEHSGNLPSPLSHYQSAKFNRETMRRLVTQTNDVCRKLYGAELMKARAGDRIDETFLTENELAQNFDGLYGELETEITEILQTAGYLSPPNVLAMPKQETTTPKPEESTENSSLTVLSQQMEDIYRQFGSYPEIARVYFEGRQILDQFRDESISQLEKGQDLVRFCNILNQAVDKLTTDTTDSNPNRRTRIKVLKELKVSVEKL